MELIGREPQLRMLADAISDAKNGRARAVTVCGEAGSGKTMLLDAAAAEARDTVHTIRIAGHPAETDLPLAGVHQLVREARFDGVVTATGQDPLRDASALLEALTTLARRRPVLLVIDDAQWLDGPSHRALVFVARRLDADAMCVVFGVRSPHDEHLTVGTRLDVGPLSRQESLALLHRTYPQMSARVAAKIAQQAVGLPLALCEIPAELDAAQQRGTEPLPADLPLGRSITGLFAKRLAALTDAARLCLLAASFDTLSPTAYVAVLRRLGCSLDDLDEAERLGLARLREGRCQFRHPLVSAAVRNEARSQHLVAVHRALVTQFADDPVRLASHLKQDPNVDPETLRTAVLQGARAARDARSYDDAAELWKSASQLASEPTQKRAFLREAVRCLALSGAGPEARTLIEQLLAETTEAIERAQVLRDLTWLSLWTQSVAPHDDERIEAHGIELIQAGDTRTREAGRDLLAALATAMLGAGEYRRAQQVCATLHEHVADRLTLEQRLLCDVIAVMAGEPGGGALLRGRWTDSYPWQHILDPATPAGFITVVPGWLGEYEIVDEVIAHCRRATDEYGPSASGFYIASSMTASQERRQGRWDRALLEFEALERMVIDTDFAAPYPFIALRHAHLLAARGDTSSCELLRQQAREQAPAWVPILAHLDHAVAGLLALSHRDFTTALQHLDLAGEIERQVGLVPSGYLPGSPTRSRPPGASERPPIGSAISPRSRRRWTGWVTSRCWGSRPGAGRWRRRLSTWTPCSPTLSTSSAESPMGSRPPEPICCGASVCAAPAGKPRRTRSSRWPTRHSCAWVRAVGPNSATRNWPRVEFAASTTRRWPAGPRPSSHLESSKWLARSPAVRPTPKPRAGCSSPNGPSNSTCPACSASSTSTGARPSASSWRLDQHRS